MSFFEDEVLTIEELAAYLKLKRQTLYRWAQKGKIPGAKIGKEWRFRRSVIEDWILKTLGGAPTPPSEGNGTSPRREAKRASAPRRKKAGPEKN